MRPTVCLCAALVLLTIGPLSPPTARADEPERRDLTTREACWYLGMRFAAAGMQRLAKKPVAALERRASFERLKRVTGMNLKDFPRLTGRLSQDGPQLGAFLRRARPKLARILSGKYDASHGALFRLGLDAQLLAVAYAPGSALARETLADMRAALPAARVPSRLLRPVTRLVESKRLRHEADPIVTEFADEVGYLLSREKGTPAPGALHPSQPPSGLDVWRLSGYASNAFLLHVQGQSRADLNEALAELAKRLGVKTPVFPRRDPKDIRKSAVAAYEYLTQTWAPPIAYRWDYRYGGSQRALFSIPLQAISLRLDYAPNAAWVKPKSRFLARYARYAGFPSKLMTPLTTLLDAGAPVRKVRRAIADLLVEGEVHYKKVEAAAAPATR